LFRSILSPFLWAKPPKNTCSFSSDFLNHSICKTFHFKCLWLLAVSLRQSAYYCNNTPCVAQESRFPEVGNKTVPKSSLISRKILRKTAEFEYRHSQRTQTICFAIAMIGILTNDNNLYIFETAKFNALKSILSEDNTYGFIFLINRFHQFLKISFLISSDKIVCQVVMRICIKRL
jgi:hypothetical protein